MGPEKVLAGLLYLPVVLVTDGAEPASFVDLLHLLQILHGQIQRLRGVPCKERVVRISRRVSLIPQCQTKSLQVAEHHKKQKNPQLLACGWNKASKFQNELST